jgi:hypothetical protein
MIQQPACLALLLSTVQTAPVDGEVHAISPPSADSQVSAAPEGALGSEAEAPLVPVLAVTPADQPEAQRKDIIVPRDTPVHLLVLSEVTTKTHRAGYRFKLRVNEPVKIDGRVVIPVGAIAWGQVTSAEGSGNVGKSGSLEAELLYVDVDGKQIRIDGQTRNEGNSGTAETVMGVLGLGIFGLFAKGNNAKIKAGEKFTAFTLEDVTLALSTP